MHTVINESVQIKAANYKLPTFHKKIHHILAAAEALG